MFTLVAFVSLVATVVVAKIALIFSIVGAAA